MTRIKPLERLGAPLKSLRSFRELTAERLLRSGQDEGPPPMLDEYLRSQPTITEQLGCNDVPQLTESRQKSVADSVEMAVGCADSASMNSEEGEAASNAAEQGDGLMKELEMMVEGSVKPRKG